MNNKLPMVHGLSFIVITWEHERVTGMKKISLLAFAALMLFHLFFNPAAFCTTGQEVLNEIQSRYEKTDDSEANFIQEHFGKGMKQPNRGEGKVYFKKKGMMRWGLCCSKPEAYFGWSQPLVLSARGKAGSPFRCLEGSQRENTAGLLVWRRKSRSGL